MATKAPKESEPIVNLDDMKGDTFTGKITDVRFGKTNPNQPDKDYVTLVMDVDYMDKPYELYIPYTTRKESVWKHFLEHLQKCDVKLASVKDLKGETFIFERKDVVLRGGFIAKEGFPLPIEHVEE